jgi:hypothetical protein
MDQPSQISKPFLLYALPLLALALCLATIDTVVPRDPVAIDQTIARIKNAKPTFGAEVMAAFYHMAIAGAFAAAICVVNLCWCLGWLFCRGYKELTINERRLFWSGLIFAIVIPLIFLAAHKPTECTRFAIDDCMASALFKNTIQIAHPARFAFAWDADLMACLVFITYLISILTVSVAAGTTPVPGKDQPNGEATLTIEQRMNVLNSVLFLTTAVLISAMLAAKLRFDVGLATLGAAPTKEAPNLAFVAYQTVASAIMAYWAAALSLCLAFIYLPGAYLLARDSGGGSTFILGPIFAPTQENFIRLLKLAAILSPPVINKLIEIIGVAQKGV